MQPERTDIQFFQLSSLNVTMPLERFASRGWQRLKRASRHQHRLLLPV